MDQHEQEPSKIVDAVGEQLRKIYDEVADDWLNPFSLGHVEVPASDLSLEQDVVADVCENSQTSPDEGPINEGPLVSSTSTLTISLEETTFAPLPHIQPDERKETCNILNKKIALTPAEADSCSCSSEIVDNHEEVSNSSTSSSHSGSLSSDRISPSEYPGTMVERGLMLSCLTDPTKEEGTTVQEVKSLVQSFLTVHEQRSLSEPETSLSIIDIESSHGAAKNEHSVTIDKNIETNEEFEDVNLEDCLDEKKREDCLEEAEKYELALISYRAMKNRSFKKKIRDAFASRFYSTKKNNGCGASFYGDTNSDPAKRGIAAAPPLPSRALEASSLLTPKFCESDWELI